MIACGARMRRVIGIRHRRGEYFLRTRERVNLSDETQGFDSRQISIPAGRLEI